MAGAPSQLDLFDYKPKLVAMNGQPCPESIYKKERFAFIKGVPKMLGTPQTVRRHPPLLGEHNDEIFAEINGTAS